MLKYDCALAHGTGSADLLRECKSVNHLVASFIDSLAVEKKGQQNTYELFSKRREVLLNLWTCGPSWDHALVGALWER